MTAKQAQKILIERARSVMHEKIDRLNTMTDPPLPPKSLKLKRLEQRYIALIDQIRAQAKKEHRSLYFINGISYSDGRPNTRWDQRSKLRDSFNALEQEIKQEFKNYEFAKLVSNDKSGFAELVKKFSLVIDKLSGE
jgi:hypothetical protein